MSVCIGTLPEGSRGIDVNERLKFPELLAITRAVNTDNSRKYKFIIRYLLRDVDYDININAEELLNIIKAKLSLMLVQHVAPAGWSPNSSKGTLYGTTAVTEARKIGVPTGITIWCDLEGVMSGAKRDDVFAFCCAWYNAVKNVGYEPGLYVGDSCGLSSQDLWKLPFKRYWAAYNLNKDHYPAVRSVQMRQYAYPPVGERIPDFPYEYDEDVIMIDTLGGTPTLLIPDEVI